jgi:hypothetical protein
MDHTWVTEAVGGEVGLEVDPAVGNKVDESDVVGTVVCFLRKVGGTVVPFARSPPNGFPSDPFEGEAYVTAIAARAAKATAAVQASTM